MENLLFLGFQLFSCLLPAPHPHQIIDTVFQGGISESKQTHIEVFLKHTENIFQGNPRE